MIKINLQTFNLVCTRISDKVRFIYKYRSKTEYRVINTETGEWKDMNAHEFRRDYEPDKELNAINKKRPEFMNFGKKRVR